MFDNPFHNLPQGWEVKTLGEVAKINPKNKLDDNLEVSFVPMNLIADKYQNKFSYKIKTWQEVKKGYTHLQDNCIAIAKITPCFENGKCIILQDLKNGYGAGTTELIIVLPNENIILLKFIFYFFNTAKFIKEGVKSFKGTAGQLRVSSDFISNLPIPLPPLEIQQRIVAKLESEFAKIEAAKSHLENVKETIPRLKNSLLKSAFSGTLTQPYKDEKGAHRHCEDSLEYKAHNPQGFCPHLQIHNAKFPLKDSIAESKVCKIIDCHELRCNSRNDESIAQNLQDCIKITSCDSQGKTEETQNRESQKDSQGYCANAQHSTEYNLPQDWEVKTLGECLTYEQPTKYIVKNTKYSNEYKIPVLTAGKSFILGYTNDTENIFTQIPVIIFDDFTTDSKFVDFHFKIKSSAMKILHATKIANIKFVFYFMQTIQYRSDTHKRYWISEYSKLPIPIPPLETQKQIVEILDSKFAALENLEEETNTSLEKLQKLKSSLLNQAFKGELIC